MNAQEAKTKAREASLRYCPDKLAGIDRTDIQVVERLDGIRERELGILNTEIDVAYALYENKISDTYVDNLIYNFQRGLEMRYDRELKLMGKQTLMQFHGLEES